MPCHRLVLLLLGSAWALIGCRSPSGLREKAGAGISVPEAAHAAGVRGILGGFARTPVSGTLRALHQGSETLTGWTKPDLPDPDAPTPDLPPLSRGPGMDLAAFELALDRTAKPIRTRGTVRFLIDGPAYFTALESALRTAREPVDLQVYIFDNDDVAVAVADDLKRTADRVPVRVIYDDLGTKVASRVLPPSARHMPKGFQPPEDIHAYLTANSTIEVRRISNIFLTSTHTKIITIGTSRAFTGGMNIGREYRYDWHDLMAELRGPVVGELREAFERTHSLTQFAGDFRRISQMASRRSRSRRAAAIPEPPGSAEIRILHTRPFDAQIERAIHLAIASARRRIWIENPYFADDRIILALIEARRRGVDVRILLPAPRATDDSLMQASNRLTASVLLKHGIRVYHYPGMTHVKAALFDDWALFGSANYDHLSLRLNEELNLASSAPAVVRALERELFLRDFRASREPSIESLRPKPTDGFAEAVADRL